MQINKIAVITDLRGVAGISVCLFYFFCFSPVSEDMPGYHLFQYGDRGVQVFFVISGIVLILSMAKMKYSLSKWSAFMKNRLLRIHPSFFVVLLLSWGIEVVRQVVLHRTPLAPLGGANFLANFFYVVPFGEGFEWYNRVFWTLSVELQFYLLMTVLYVVLMKFSRGYLFISVLWGLSVFSTDDSLLFYWLPIFLFGIIWAIRKLAIFNSRTYYVLLLLNCMVSYHVNGLIDCLVALVTILIVTVLENKSSYVFRFLGKISYSVYLIHLPLVYKVIFEIQKHSTSLLVTFLYSILVVFLSVLVGYIYYLLIEKKFTSKIREYASL